jgi:acetyltransferase EpsM
MIIVGAGGHAKVIAEILELCGKSNICFWVDNVEFEELLDYKVSSRLSFSEDNVIIGIGDNSIRKKIFENNHYSYTNAIHPSSTISIRATLGHGNAVMAGAIINSNVIIGHHVIINSGSIIEHDCKIEDFAHISPNCTIAGSVIVGEGSWIGAGATIIQGVKVGKWAIVGAGTVVIRDVPDYAVVVGNPQRIIKYNKFE